MHFTILQSALSVQGPCALELVMFLLVSSLALFNGLSVFSCRVWFFFLMSKYLKIKEHQLKKTKTTMGT